MVGLLVRRVDVVPLSAVRLRTLGGTAVVKNIVFIGEVLRRRSHDGVVVNHDAPRFGKRPADIFF